MLSRRAFSLATLAVAGTGLLAGCAGSSKEEAPTPGTTKLELVSSDVDRAAADAAAIPAAVASLHALGAGLWQELRVEDENLALSPYSVAVALAMTAVGAVGTTQREMLDVLAADSSVDLDTGLNALTQHIESLAEEKAAQEKAGEEKIELAAANQLFGQQAVPWEQDFLDTLAREYGAGMRTVDYVGAPESARAAVNRWTADRTYARIEEILPPDSVDPSTRLVLVNALSFKAPWLEPFEKSLTADADFHLADGTVVQVPTMTASTRAAYGSGDGWVSVRIPYAGATLAMTVVLPDSGQEVDLDTLPDILASAESSGVELSLPRWTFRTEAPLKRPLSALGMRAAFDDATADLSGMTRAERLVVDDVHHQVFVAVDESGTEAAAATAVVAREVSAMITEHRVVVDRPFVFVIHDVEHGTPLFVGQVVDPRG